MRRVQQPGRDRSFFCSPGCEPARCHRSLLRHHRPVRRATARRAGRPPRPAPPEHRHRRRDRAAHRGRRTSRAPNRCAFPAAEPGPECSRRRLRAAVLKTAQAWAGQARRPPVHYSISECSEHCRRPASATCAQAHNRQELGEPAQCLRRRPSAGLLLVAAVFGTKWLLRERYAVTCLWIADVLVRYGVDGDDSR